MSVIELGPPPRGTIGGGDTAGWAVGAHCCSTAYDATGLAGAVGTASYAGLGFQGYAFTRGPREGS